MEKLTVKRTRRALIFLVALIFLATTIGLAQAGTFQIQPKGKKKIKIGVMDLISSIEVSANTCKWYRHWAKEKGWELQVFDLGFDLAKAQSVMDNMITAGYDGIIVNWVDFRNYDQQIMKAYKKGIPVQGIACGNMVPGVVSHGIAPDMVNGSMSATYLASKLRTGDKILVYYDPSEHHVAQLNAAKVVFDAFKIKIVQELMYKGTGDPSQVCYEMMKNAILADTQKEIKGVLTLWEGYGIPTARAALELGRKDIVVMTIDASQGFYQEMRNLPNLLGSSDGNYDTPNWSRKLFENFDIIFAGKPFEDQEIWFSVPVLITKDNLPPPGYYYNPSGYKGRPQDFKVK